MARSDPFEGSAAGGTGEAHGERRTVWCCRGALPHLHQYSGRHAGRRSPGHNLCAKDPLRIRQCSQRSCLVLLLYLTLWKQTFLQFGGCSCFSWCGESMDDGVTGVSMNIKADIWIWFRREDLRTRFYGLASMECWTNGDHFKSCNISKCRSRPGNGKVYD